MKFVPVEGNDGSPPTPDRDESRPSGDHTVHRYDVIVGGFMEAGEVFTLRGAVYALVGAHGRAPPWLITMGGV